jgi:sulfur carrier protein ThiS
MTPSFKAELHELIDKYRDHPGTCLEDLVDALETEAEVLVEEVNARIVPVAQNPSTAELSDVTRRAVIPKLVASVIADDGAA